MDILKFLTKEGPVAGIEINDHSLRIVLFEKGKASSKLKFSYEELLVPGDIQGGFVFNETGFTKSLKNLVSQARVKFAIISISNDNIYSKLYDFPAPVTGKKLDDSIKLITDFQLPIKKEENYMDWEKRTGKKNQALFSSINKQQVDKLVGCMENAGLKTVAIEYHALSLARLLNPDTNCLIIEKEEKNMSFSIFQQGLSLLYVTPLEGLDLAKEANKLMNYFETEYGKSLDRIVLIGNFASNEISSLPIKPSSPEIKEEYKEIVMKLDQKWLTAIGTALRGLVPRRDDKSTSLASIGTEEAYRQQQMIVFADFVTRTTIAISIIFILAFAGTWLMMVSLQKNFSTQFLSTGSPGASLENDLRILNGMIIQAGSLAKEEIRWSSIVREISSMVPTGIKISNFKTASPYEPIILTGTAINRDQLNTFKKTLENSTILTAVNLPLGNFEKKNDIPFTISFNLKDPLSLYYK